MKNRAGATRRNLSGVLEYTSFQVAKLPPNPPIILDASGKKLLSQATKELATLSAVADMVPDKDLFVAAYIRKEALLSSQIEGTQATIEDVFDNRIDETINLDVGEVINYVKAMNEAQKLLPELPLSGRFLKTIHGLLLSRARGSDKHPGEFRTSQNWIGSVGSTLKNARYIPPTVEDMTEAMSDLEKFIHESDDMDPLIACALIHYQFESIHPFLDGNGRVGRMLIVLYLLVRSQLSQPVLTLSCFLKENQVEYYDRLNAVRQNGDYEQWVTFFLRGIAQASKDAVQNIRLLTELHLRNSKRIEPRDQNVFAYLERQPILDAKKTANALSMPYDSVNRSIARLVEQGIVIMTNPSKKTRTYVYQEYVDILKMGF